MSQQINFKLALLLGTLCFLGALIVTAPATLLAQMLSEQKQQPFRLANTQGTIWQGQATVVVENDTQQLTLGHVAWQLKDFALLNPEATVALVWNNQPPALVKVSNQTVSIDNLNLSLPANMIAFCVPSLNAVSLGGQLDISSAHLGYINQSFEGNASISWQQASADISKVNPLGHFIMAITGRGSELSLQLSTANGPLQLSGNGAWSPPSNLSFNGQASATSELEAISPLLHSIGNEEAANSGLFHFRLAS